MILSPAQIMNMRLGMPRNNTNGGGGGSESSSSTATNNYDKRVAVNEGIGLSADSSTITINALDGGAINAALDYANKSFGAAALVANNSVIGSIEAVDRGAARAISAVDLGAARAIDAVDRGAARESASLNLNLDFARTVFERGLSVLDTAGKQVEAQAGLISKAWDNAQGQGTEKQTLMYVAVAAVTVVSVAVVIGARR